MKRFFLLLTLLLAGNLLFADTNQGFLSCRAICHLLESLPRCGYGSGSQPLLARGSGLWGSGR